MGFCFQIVYPEDKFVFRDIDLGPYDLAREMGAYPYAIVHVEYKFPERGERPIWCCILLLV